ncbi:MAG TPA: hypothetical protein VN932_07290 [Rhizomicrobium sp.]|nr:hypothetical protein [Rhizomicrobium sp.]
MPAKSTGGLHVVGNGLPTGISPYEAARYTQELIDSLRELALSQRQLKLAELLAASAAEAGAIAASLRPSRIS